MTKSKRPVRIALAVTNPVPYISLKNRHIGKTAYQTQFNIIAGKKTAEGLTRQQ